MCPHRVIKVNEYTRELLCRFAQKAEGPSRVYASAILDLLAVEAGEDPVIIFTLRQMMFSDLIGGIGDRARLLEVLLDTLKTSDSRAQ